MALKRGTGGGKKRGRKLPCKKRGHKLVDGVQSFAFVAGAGSSSPYSPRAIPFGGIHGVVKPAR
jgi:hypothetical protein